MRRRYTQSELQRAALWWVVSFDFGGRTWRVSQSALSVESTDLNRWISVSAGLASAETELTAPWMGATAEVRTASLELSIPDLDVGLLLSRGYELDGAPVEVAIHKNGGSWDDRMVVLTGQIVEYSWGAKGEILAIEAAETVDEDRSILPPPGAVVSASTWVDAPEDSLGAAYPWIIGAPGSDGTQAAPARFVADTTLGAARNLLLVAGHPVTATAVLVSDSTSTESLLIEHMADLQGRTVAVVDLDAATGLAVDATLVYTTAWTSGAGLVGVSGTDASGAGSALEAVLLASTLPVDLGTLAALRASLDAWEVGAYIEEPISPMAWATDALLPLLPVALLTGPSGWRFLPCPISARNIQAIGTLTASQSIRRTSPVQVVGREEVATRVELRYALESGGDNAKTVVAGPDYDAGEHPSMPTRKAAQIYGRRARSEESVAVYDDNTAMRVVRHIATSYAFPRQQIEYTGAALRWLQPGDIVSLTDSELTISARLAWVEMVRMTPETASVRLVLWRALQ